MQIWMHQQPQCSHKNWSTGWREFAQIAGEEEFGGEGLLLSSRGPATYRPFCSIYFESDQFSCKWNMILPQQQKTSMTGSGEWAVSLLCAIVFLSIFENWLSEHSGYKFSWAAVWNKTREKYSWYNSRICNTKNTFALKLCQILQSELVWSVLMDTKGIYFLGNKKQYRVAPGFCKMSACVRNWNISHDLKMFMSRSTISMQRSLGSQCSQLV